MDRYRCDDFHDYVLPPAVLGSAQPHRTGVGADKIEEMLPQFDAVGFFLGRGVMSSPEE